MFGICQGLEMHVVAGAVSPCYVLPICQMHDGALYHISINDATSVLFSYHWKADCVLSHSLMCVTFCFVSFQTRACDWWGLRGGIRRTGNTGASSSTGKDPDLTPWLSCVSQAGGKDSHGFCHRTTQVFGFSTFTGFRQLCVKEPKTLYYHRNTQFDARPSVIDSNQKRHAPNEKGCRCDHIVVVSWYPPILQLSSGGVSTAELPSVAIDQPISIWIPITKRRDRRWSHHPPSSVLCLLLTN